MSERETHVRPLDNNDEDTDVSSEQRGEYADQGIPAENIPEAPGHHDTFVQTSDGGTTGGPGLGRPVTPPAEGGDPTNNEGYVSEARGSHPENTGRTQPQ